MTDLLAVLLAIGLFAAFGFVKHRRHECAEAESCASADANCGSGSCHVPPLLEDAPNRESNDARR
jgi:hypothetical protein